MAVEKSYRCDLSGEIVARGELVTFRVGLRDWRPEDYVPVDLGPCCRHKTMAEVLEHAEAQPEWTDVVH